ncbi:competence protein ComEC [Planomicrobium koreense]|uniref:Competence protein ComEC n=1 Tax=Planococcus koreensis TaxID=112331 RepID=A0A7W8FVF1_9BACL|nr:DNA internalization-related competence protein ComEC/Rec2 [Planococcus koreensis]MBB5180802.1 competence protein ComEC [Planococcus koreensis]
MFWKREGAKLFIHILAITICVYMLQEQRVPTVITAAAYSGELDFAGNYTIDGDSLRGFAELANGQKVYAAYRFKDAEEKAEAQAALPASKLVVAGVFEAVAEPSHRFSFDMARYLETNGAAAMLTIEKIDAFKAQHTFYAKMLQQRKKLGAHINASFPAELATEAEALLIGEQRGMGIEERQIYQTLGITHLFAISGLHVAIVAGLAYFLLVRLRVHKESALLLLLAMLPLYAIMAGGAPSVLRAVCMVSLVLAGKLANIRLPASSVLLGSFLFFVIWNPYAIYNIGFQLSYGAAFGIIYSRQLLARCRSAFEQGLLITAISQMTLYPILLFHFYEISISAFAVNSLFVPLYTLVILPVNLLALGLTLVFPPAANALFFIYAPCREWIGDGMAWLASWPYQMWNPGRPAPWLAMGLLASVLLFYGLAEKRFRARQLLIVLVPAALFTAMPYLDPALKVTFLDVGQGDSAVIELPHRRAVYVIDTGGLLRFGTEEFRQKERPFEIGRQVVVPYLKGNGISTVDLLVLSHADADHAEGADELFKALQIRNLHLTPGSQTTPLMQELAKDAGEAKLSYPTSGSGWTQGTTRFRYLSPGDAEYSGNDDSLVLLLENSGFRALFTGDLELAGEKKIVEAYSGELAGLTILKIGHHGSKTSSGQEFLEAAMPKLSIFSTGKDNRYGHPNPDVVGRFQKLNLPVLNTAESGTIEVEVVDGEVELRKMR